jgi:hypothetical protein
MGLRVGDPPKTPDRLKGAHTTERLTGAHPPWTSPAKGQSIRTSTAARCGTARSIPPRWRARLARLREAIEAKPGAAAGAARREYDRLVSDLAASTGLGGRVRPFTDNGERAWLAVGKAIRRAIDRIEAVHPLIGRHLRNAVRTGRSCSYRPT